MLIINKQINFCSCVVVWVDWDLCTQCNGEIKHCQLLFGTAEHSTEPNPTEKSCRSPYADGWVWEPQERLAVNGSLLRIPFIWWFFVEIRLSRWNHEGSGEALLAQKTFMVVKQKGSKITSPEHEKWQNFKDFHFYDFFGTHTYVSQSCLGTLIPSDMLISDRNLL